MIRNEYLRFLRTLDTNPNPNVKKIANLVLEHLDDLIDLSPYTKPSRAKKIADLAQEQWKDLSSNIQVLPNNSTPQNSSISRLSIMKVGPFRGFIREETLDLNKQVILVYGPNGSGKTSFCEALEYGLLGSVSEAESRGFRRTEQYLKNAHTNKSISLSIQGIDENQREVPLQPNEEKYRFCFVEKNRIDNFSRLGAKTPAKQAELVSTLFGLDSFNQFTRYFTPEIEQKHLDLEGQNQKQLKEKRIALSTHQSIVDSFPKTQEELNEEKSDLAERYKKGCSFEQMKNELQGNDGRISQLENDLQENIPTSSGVTKKQLATIKNSIDESINNSTRVIDKLEKSKSEVSFRNLYQAINQLQNENLEQCPACKTPLEQATQNPFEHAETELDNLKQVTGLEDQLDQLNEELALHRDDLIKLLSSVKNNLEPILLPEILQNMPHRIDSAWWLSLFEKNQNDKSPWSILESEVAKLEENDLENNKKRNNEKEKNKELKRLRLIEKEIDLLIDREKTETKKYDEAKDNIDIFKEQNAKLIISAEKEKPNIERNRAIADAYKEFVNRLNAYKISLPQILVEDLGESVVELYNAFNDGDAEHEKISSVRLPLLKDQKLEISFNTNPDQYFDALQKLSEGHLRCIGLAIILAKNLKEQCPFIIFDDPVNAIDDEHRRAIRKTLFQNTLFNDKQIILTCHGEEFLKDIENDVGLRNATTNIQTITLLNQQDEPHIQIKPDSPPRHYIAAANMHLNNGEIRDSISKCRQALENLTRQIWRRYLPKYRANNLSLCLTKENSHPELRNLTERITSKIRSDDVKDPNKENLLKPLQYLLGNDGQSEPWRHLNNRTHEQSDLQEVNRSVAQEIIQALTQIDECLNSGNQN